MVNAMQLNSHFQRKGIRIKSWAQAKSWLLNKVAYFKLKGIMKPLEEAFPFGFQKDSLLEEF